MSIVKVDVGDMFKPQTGSPKMGDVTMEEDTDSDQEIMMDSDSEIPTKARPSIGQDLQAELRAFSDDVTLSDSEHSLQEAEKQSDPENFSEDEADVGGNFNHSSDDDNSDLDDYRSMLELLATTEKDDDVASNLSDLSDLSNLSEDALQREEDHLVALLNELTGPTKKK